MRTHLSKCFVSFSACNLEYTYTDPHNGIARIFVWGGATRPMPTATFSVISGSRPDSVGGGGVVADIFRDPRDLPDSVGGGGSGRNFPGNYGSRSIKFPQLRDIFFTFPGRLNVTASIHCTKKNISQKFGGAVAPLAPPGYATALTGH